MEMGDMGGGVFGVGFNVDDKYMKKEHFLVGCRINGATKSFTTKREAVEFIEKLFADVAAAGDFEILEKLKIKTDLIKITMEAKVLPLNGVEVEPSKPIGESAKDFINGLKVKEGGEKPK